MFNITLPAMYEVRWYDRTNREITARDGYKYVHDRCSAMADIKHGCAKHGLRALAVKNGRTYAVTESGYLEVPTT